MIMKKVGTADTYGVTNPGISETGYGSGGGNGWLIINNTGFYNHDGTPLGTVPTALWESSDMMRVIITANFTDLDVYDPTLDSEGKPNGRDGGLDFDYWMELFLSCGVLN